MSQIPNFNGSQRNPVPFGPQEPKTKANNEEKTDSVPNVPKDLPPQGPIYPKNPNRPGNSSIQAQLAKLDQNEKPNFEQFDK